MALVDYIGATVHLSVQGAQRSYELVGRLVDVDNSSLSFQTESGKTLRIPTDKVLTFASPAEGLASKTDADTIRRHLAGLDDLLTDELEPGKDEQLTSDVDRALRILRSVGSGLSVEVQRIIEDVIELLECCLEHARAESFDESEQIREGMLLLAKEFASDLNRSRDFADAEPIGTFFNRFRAAEAAEWNRYVQQFDPQPRIVTADRVVVSVDSSHEFDLPLRVSLDTKHRPARAVSVDLEEPGGIHVITHPAPIGVLAGGSTETVTFRMSSELTLPTTKELVVKARLVYRGADGYVRHAPRQHLRVALHQQRTFREIPNPYERYASGEKVDDPKMFFGRGDLIGSVVEALSTPAMGRCFAIYGQQRSGKSSVIGQVKTELERRGAIVASLTMGIIDRSDLTASFISAALDQFRLQVVSRLPAGSVARLLNSWPGPERIHERPLQRFQAALSASRILLDADAKTRSRPFVVIADEFTYLFEVLRRDNANSADSENLRDFMRQWKGLIEGRVISALIVGQDTMPGFLSAFPNEFSIMSTTRLDYLSEEETRSLAHVPTRYLDGQSRFTGHALASIVAYTDGHPFFTQILCDRIIRMANEDRREGISEDNVHAAVLTLIDGDRQIDVHRFGCLLSADNTGIVTTGSQQVPMVRDETARIAFRLLVMLAQASGPNNRDVDVSSLNLKDLADKAVWSDLVARRVIRQTNGGVRMARIRIKLFSDYLRNLA